MRPNPSLKRRPATAATVWPLQAMVEIVLPRPAGVCLHGRLSSNVRRHVTTSCPPTPECRSNAGKPSSLSGQRRASTTDRARMRVVRLLSLIPLLAGCHTVTTLSPVGCYSAGDASRYNHLYLQLSEDRTFSLRLVGDITIWGAATGQWSISDGHITLQTGSTGVLTSPATSLSRRDDSSLVLPDGSVRFSGWSPLRPSQCEPGR